MIMKLATFPVKWPRKILISKVSACSQVDQPANPDLLPPGKKLTVTGTTKLLLIP